MHAVILSDDALLADQRLGRWIRSHRAVEWFRTTLFAVTVAGLSVLLLAAALPGLSRVPGLIGDLLSHVGLLASMLPAPTLLVALLVVCVCHVFVGMRLVCVKPVGSVPRAQLLVDSMLRHFDAAADYARLAREDGRELCLLDLDRMNILIKASRPAPDTRLAGVSA